ncbi:hypothetical protein [Actinoplanes rectilineatus]|uniref:hypothetical protein n=1 Tax=Actinoplanes rectilineatus TaxID=113571 RepID=UPI0012FB3B63|nr:hypothetical protein [Actinoplanes rectilineatus]
MTALDPARLSRRTRPSRLAPRDRSKSGDRSKAIRATRSSEHETSARPALHDQIDGPGRAGLGRTGPGWAGPSWAGPSWAGPSWAGPSWAGPSWAGPGRAGLGRAGPGRAGMAGPGRPGERGGAWWGVVE